MYCGATAADFWSIASLYWLGPPWLQAEIFHSPQQKEPMKDEVEEDQDLLEEGDAEESLSEESTSEDPQGQGLSQTPKGFCGFFCRHCPN